MKFFKFLFIILSLNSFATFSQAISNGSTLTVTDLSGSYVYYEHNISLSGAFVSALGSGAPLNTPVIIKITSNGTSISPYFITGDLNGTCDTFLSGSMNSTNNQFTTTLSCSGSIAEGYANGIRFNIPIKCATDAGSTGTDCIEYSIYTSCDLYCISFSLQSNNELCRKKNYTAVINFTDHTSTTINVNFASNNTIFCFPKAISTLGSSTFSNCNCGVSQLLKQSTNSKKIDLTEGQEIIISPNPTNSIIKFSGANLDKYNVSIFDANGKIIIKNSKINSEISLEKQTKGIYIYIIEGENGFRQEGKILKE